MFVKRDFIGMNDLYAWKGVVEETYEQPELAGVSKQVVVGENDGAGFEVRYYHFAKESKGDLARHDKAYCFFILHGSGELLVNDELHELKTRDVVYIPARALVQVMPKGGDELGFLCVVNG